MVRIERITDRPRLHQALALLLGRPGLSPLELDQQVDALVRYARKNKLSLEHCWAALAGKHILAASLVLDGPGRMAHVLIPSCESSAVDASVLVQLLSRQIERAQARGIRYLQGFVEPAADRQAASFREAGFEYLARLHQLQRDLSLPLPCSQDGPSLDWVAYSSERKGLFLDVLHQSYAQSLDCPGLSNRRDMDDIWSSHQGVGPFHPDYWLVGLVDQRAAGLILINEMPERWSCELVYMGLVPAYRGRGYGCSILGHGLQIVRQQPFTRMTLCVDERNEPARRLYERFGFTPVQKRDVWIRFL